MIVHVVGIIYGIATLATNHIGNMSGLNEIIQWTEENYDFEEGEDPKKAFDQIDRDEDWRSPLADILGDQLGEYMEFIEEQTRTSRADIEISELDFRLAQLEQEIRNLTGTNILGTPIR